MAHNIMRFVERNGYAWHGIATARLDGDSNRTATHALEMAEGDYGVISQPLYYPDDDTGEWIKTSRVALIRPAWKGEPKEILGWASDEYRPLQNGELCRLLDPLTADWPLETLGILGKGETIFATLDAGTTTIGGDDIKQFMFAYNSHDGNSAFKINITPIRVVCQNTCITGLRQATVTADVVHTRRILQEAEFAIGLVAQIRRAQLSTTEALSRLTKVRISYDDLKYVLENVYPERPDPRKLTLLQAAERGEVELSPERIAELQKVQLNAESQRDQAVRLRLTALNEYGEFNDSRPSFANTGWALYNGITSTECWRAGGTDESRGRQILMGGTRGQRMAMAFMALNEIANRQGVAV